MKLPYDERTGYNQTTYIDHIKSEIIFLDNVNKSRVMNVHLEILIYRCPATVILITPILTSQCDMIEAYRELVSSKPRLLPPLPSEFHKKKEENP